VLNSHGEDAWKDSAEGSKQGFPPSVCTGKLGTDDR